jgi:hypothetical protein
MDRCGRWFARLGAATLLVAPPLAAQAPLPAGDSTYVVEYYYTARWGYADEFWRLWVKNHLPVMRLEQERGHIRDLVVERPRFHGTEDGRWDFRVRITYPSAAEHAKGSPVTGDDRRRLFPDQETFQREEQRRFEILRSHWDLPVERIAVRP